MRERPNRWSPNEFRKTFFAIAGVGFIASGFYLFLNQTKAAGNLKLSVFGFSCDTNSASAGIYMCIFGIVTILLSSVLHSNKNESRIKWNELITKETVRIFFISIIIIVAIIAFIIIQNPAILILAVIMAFPFIKSVLD